MDVTSERRRRCRTASGSTTPAGGPSWSTVPSTASSARSLQARARARARRASSTRFVTRQKKDGSWEKVDHETLVRACADPNADEALLTSLRVRMRQHA